MIFLRTIFIYLFVYTNDTAEKSDNRDIGQQSRKEETYLQQSQKSVYYEKCSDIFNDILKYANDQRQDPGNLANNDHINVLSSPAYAEYLLNNWCGLLPFSPCLHFDAQGRHGCSDVYIR